ncbi:hypothetical protein [Pseudomonas fulva]|uniref:hypothetical protein n=1 Tax=Pseudomonas fulva TaxID=47880 RepID=UPI003CF9F896
MNVGCYLPPTFEDFCKALGMTSVPVYFEPNYAGLQVAERRGDWVVDGAVRLATEITIAEDKSIHAVISQKPDMTEILSRSDNINMFKKNLWFLKSLTDEKIQTDRNAKADWSSIKSAFRLFNRARKAGENIDSNKSKLLKVVKELEKKYKADSEHEILKPHRNLLHKRKELARNIFPYNIVDIYNRAQASSKSAGAVDKRSRVQIGLGVQSTFVPKNVKRDSVVLDDKTTPTKTTDKSILYAAGWSLKPEEQ